MLRGSQIHLLLEHLPEYPPSEWAHIASSLLQDDLLSSSEVGLADLLAEATAVLSAPDLAWMFDPKTLAEVPLTADLGGRRLHGVIDRLVVTPDSVLAVDFKTNATVPAGPNDTPDGLLRQMGAYAHALSQIYPNRRIETGILWTRTAKFMPLTHDLVTKALATTGYLDVSGPQT
jgi:ATP-dependent helicase/nuclease subunit A